MTDLDSRLPELIGGRTAKALELQSLNAVNADRTLASGDVQWIARVVWASQ